MTHSWDRSSCRWVRDTIPEFDFPHQRQVEWLSFDEWKMPESSEGLQSTVRELGKFNENIAGYRTDGFSRLATGDNRRRRLARSNETIRLSGIPGRIQSVLDRKGQVILYGPPGTGKTYWAEKTANDLAAISAFGKLFESLSETEKKVSSWRWTEIGVGATLLFPSGLRLRRLS